MNDQQLLRYSRQLLLPQFGIEKQQLLLTANVLIIGLGGIGCPVAMYLAAAGIGKLTLVDYDDVDLANLQRQIAYKTSDIGQAKTNCLKQTLENINPSIHISLINEKFSLENDLINHALSEADVVIDTTDNFSTRFAINKLCLRYKKILVSGAAIEMQGQVAVFNNTSPNDPCYQCLFPDVNEKAQGCSDLGILSPVVGIVGSVLAVEAIKIITQLGKTLIKKLMLINAITMDISYKNYKKDPNCKTCSMQ